MSVLYPVRKALCQQKVPLKSSHLKYVWSSNNQMKCTHQNILRGPTPHYKYFTTWSLINLRSSGLLSAISIAYESNCSATSLSGELTAFQKRTQHLNARTASSQWVVVIPSSLTWLNTPVASKNSTPSSITWFKLDKMVNTLDFTFAYGSILSGSKGDSASWRESLRLSWAQARNTFRSSVALLLDNNFWWQFQDGHLELRIIDPVNQVKGFKASVIARIAAHTWIQFLILEGSLVNNWFNHVMTNTSTNIMSITGMPA